MADRFDATWRASCVIAPVTTAEARSLIIPNHYLHSFPAVVSLRLGLYHGPFLRGVIVFAYPPPETATRYGGVTWELARLWIGDDLPRNAETWFIGKALRHIRTNYRHVAFVVSYADPSAGHSGVIYQAANFKADGRTDDERKTPRFDWVVDGKRYGRASHVPTGAVATRLPRISKHRYVYAMNHRKESTQ